MKLTARTVAAARYDGKARKLYDGNGLFLHLTATARTWRYGYRLGGRQRTYTIGPADVLSLADAREAHREARRLVLEGRDPVAARDDRRREARESPTVEAAIDSWYARKLSAWAPSNSSKIRVRLGALAPGFLSRQLADLTHRHVADEILRIADARSIDLAHRLLWYVRGALDDAVLEERIVTNPARHPSVAMRVPKAPPQKRYPHITDTAELGHLLAAIEGYVGNARVAAALWLQPRLFCRPIELRNLTWAEINFEARHIELSAERMKARVPHLIPLADQCLAVLERLRVEQRSDYVFFSPRRVRQPISDMALTVALGRLGYESGSVVPHGFRHTASTLLNERQFDVQGEATRFRPDVIEAQLAHVPRGVRAVYNRATYLDERRVMMQAYADFLDGLRDQAASPSRLASHARHSDAG